MTFLFSEPGMLRLDEIIRPGALCVFDFDGTLSPIVTEHQDAFLPSDILQQLLRLSAYAPVAVITGRSVDDIRTRLRFAPRYIVGNHGLEGVPGWDDSKENFIAMCDAWEKTLLRELQNHEMFDAGIRLESKRYSLSVHYRQASDHVNAERQLLALFEKLTPRPRVMRGKYVFNLLPKDAADKGRALEQLMHVTGAPSAIYVGDDVTDEDVFRLQRRDILSVRIEKDTRSAAEFFLNDRLEISRLLDELIQRTSSLHDQDLVTRASV